MILTSKTVHRRGQSGAAHAHVHHGTGRSRRQPTAFVCNRFLSIMRSGNRGPFPPCRGSVLALGRAVLACVCFALVMEGCAKKQIKQGVPFGLDTIPTEKVVHTGESWREKGMRLVHENDYQQAIEAFKNYVVENPEDSFGFNALAVCYKNLGDHSAAMRNYERALELVVSPEEKAKILANIGNLYFSANKPQVALGFYKEAAEFDKNPLDLVLIARTFIVLQEFDRAKKVLEEAETLRDRPGNSEKGEDRGLAAYLMAHSYAALGEGDKVVEYLRKALEANPKRFVPRLKRDLSDQKNILYTLKEDPELLKTLDSYSLEALLNYGFKQKDR